MRCSKLFYIVLIMLMFSDITFCEDKRPNAKFIADQIDLKNCINIAQTNSEQLKIVLQDIKINKLKRTEAKRNFYPAVSLKAEETKGDAIRELGTPAFLEKNYGVETSWLLYEGGKVINTKKQADHNYFLSELKHKKVILDINFAVEKAYWNVIRAKNNLIQYELAHQKILKLKNMGDTLFKQGFISEKDKLTLAEGLNQAIYNVSTTKNDLENYLWELTDAMNLDDKISKSPNPEFNLYDLTFSLEECLNLALKNNLDIQIQNHILFVKMYDSKIKKSYKYPKLELTGFYGQSGGAYESEDFDFVEDYKVGLQLTQVFWLNTFSASGSRQKTSPKLGQSSRTNSNTVTTSLALLDGYKRKYELFESDKSYADARYALKKAKNKLKKEVRTAFFNYQKALAQVQNSALDVEISKRQLEIKNLELGADKSSIVDIVEAINKYRGAEIALIDAKIFQNVSWATLIHEINYQNKN